MAKITANCLVKNEERWIWFSLISVLDYVDEILVWDTGSTDDTIKIIQSIKSPKLKFSQPGPVDANQFTKLRQKMLEESRADWLLILDGDEIWTKAALAASLSIIHKPDSDVEFITNKNLALLGDVYHHQNDSGSLYKIGPYSGHINIRFVNLNLIPGLHFKDPYGKEGLFDDQNMSIQNRQSLKTVLVDTPYLHATHLHRSRQDSSVMQRSAKLKHELGKSIPKDFAYPKCFYLPRPQLVRSPWDHHSKTYLVRSFWQTPLRRLKRLLPKTVLKNTP